MDNVNQNSDAENSSIDSGGFTFSYQERDADYLRFEDENGYIHNVRCVEQVHAGTTEQSIADPVLGRYVVKEAVLGAGGQGIVLRSSDPFVAVKLAQENKQDITDPGKISAFNQQMKNLIYLQLPPDLNVSMPYAVLADHAGYVMRLLNTAEPIGKSLMSNSARPLTYVGGRAVSQLAEKYDTLLISSGEDRRINIVPKNNDDKKPRGVPLLRYTISGGARIRCEALGKTAAVLGRLHGRGLVYGDISGNNVFIAADHDDSCTVWLIDADNLDYEKKRGVIVYTPSYGAPELVQHVDGIRFVSDCHAFGVLVSQVLTWVHPFHGKMLEDPDGDDWGDASATEMTMEQKADAGLLPWIDDPTDRSNEETHISKMLPRNIFLTELLRNISRYTFCEGRTSPSLRPTMFHWCRALIQERDMTLKCSKCGMSIPYLPGTSAKCICCDADPLAPYILELQSFRLLPQGRMKQPEWVWHHELDPDLPMLKVSSSSDSPSGESEQFRECLKDSLLFTLPERIFLPFNIRSFDDSFMQVKYIPARTSADGTLSGYLRFSPVSDSDCQLYFAGLATEGRFCKIDSNGRVVDQEEILRGFSIVCLTKQGYSRLVNVNLRRC